MAPNQVWCRVTCVGGSGAVVATSVLAGPGAPDLATVEELARLRLEATRRGLLVVVSEVAPALAELLELVGLRGQMCAQVACGEGPLRVEEGVEAADPPV